MRILSTLALCLVLAGCAALQLPSDATTEQKRAALCYDAQTGYALSVVMLEAAKPGGAGMTETARVYWAAYKAGTELAIVRYCGN